jgi:fatty acid elongase 3
LTETLSAPPATFSWGPDTPLSDVSAPLTAIAVYLLVVGALLLHMRARGGKAYAVPTAVAAGHNLVLSLGSLAMLVGACSEVLARVRAVEGGKWDWFFCERADQVPTSGALFFWSYVYYLSKYYELLDTVIGILRGSRMPNFKLQVYHHVCVVLMAWFWMETAQSLQFGGLLFNTLVHVVMYAYYTARVLKIHVPKVLKMAITKLQVAQFTTSFVLLCWSFRYEWQRRAAGKRSCMGYAKEDYYSMWYNVVFNATLLVSFVGVFNVNKKKMV